MPTEDVGLQFNAKFPIGHWEVLYSLLAGSTRCTAIGHLQQYENNCLESYKQ